MKTDANIKLNRRAGFSMIEVLVASTILIVIVMLLSMLFQQTSVAWRTGQIRALGAKALRSYIGTIQRDAAAAFDAKNLPDGMRCKLNGLDGKQFFDIDENGFNNEWIGFYTLTGDAYTSPFKRSLSFITYRLDGTRTKYEFSQGVWKKLDPVSVLDFQQNASTEERNAVKPITFKIKLAIDKNDDEYDKNGNLVAKKNRFPLYLMVDASLKQKGKLYDVGAESSGPDGEFGDNPDKAPGKDDIRTWAK